LLSVSPAGPEHKAGIDIDRLLTAAAWHVCDYGAHDISKPCAIREFPLKQGHGHADYLLYLHGKAVGVIEAKKFGHTLKGIETQSAKYTAGLPDDLPGNARCRSLSNPPARKPSSATIWIPSRARAESSPFINPRAWPSSSKSPKPTRPPKPPPITSTAAAPSSPACKPCRRL
jgi:hypothetical protein